MKKFGLAVCLSSLILLIPGGGFFSQTIPVTHQGNLRVLTLQGTPYELGRQHGEALKQDIGALVGLWKEDIRKTYRVDPDAFIKKFLAGTDFENPIKKWTPQLWDELRGISEGSGIDFDTMFTFQLVDEVWVLGREIMAEKCTTIGLKKTERHPAVVAQNLDIPPFYHGFQTLLHIKDPDRDMETYLFTFPGFIAANGLNSHAVAVVVNAVQQLESSRDGLPVAFVIRGILDRKTFADAVRFIRTIKHGAPQNYLIGGSGGIGSYECSTTNVLEFTPFEGASFTYHTNHPLKNLNYSPGFMRYLDTRDLTPEDYERRCPRFEALQGMFKDNSVTVDMKMLRDIFSDRETIINNQGTFGCTIMMLGERPELHISPGRPDQEPFQVFRFEEE